MRSRWRQLGFRSGLAVFVGGVGALVAIACVTPPPELPPSASQRPTVVRDTVNPSPDMILQALPPQFNLSVQVADPTDPKQATFIYDVFVDYDPVNNPNPVNNLGVTVTPAAARTPVAFSLLQRNAPPNTCHRIDFVVAHAFQTANGATYYHTPDSVGGDEVVWFYFPGGSPSGCPVYDAGIYQDGAFPPPDAPSDALFAGSP